MPSDFIHQDIKEVSDQHHLESYKLVLHYNKTSKVRKWSLYFFLILLVILFLPWTQNIRARGVVTTLRQEQRPQQVNTIIPGKILRWYFKEGDIVKKGDTILVIGEVKDDYFDPQLLKRVQLQIDAKKNSLESYIQKANFAGLQIEALVKSRDLKLRELDNKINQQRQKIQSDSIEYVAAKTDQAMKAEQLRRQKIMYEKDLISLTQLEQRSQILQDANAKRISAEIKFENAKNELSRLIIEKNGESQQYAEKISKAESDRFQSISQVQTNEGEIAKMQNQYENYNIRRGLQVILAPQDGQIIRAKKAGIGEYLKDGEMIAEIVPKKVDLAVEMFVKPMDMPLIRVGQRVSFLFDGFPAIVFSGWPQASYGTFRGEVTAIERDISPNGKFRLLVKEVEGEKKWPKELMIGTGVECIALLKDVRIWYELWRNVNGFPPDYYIQPNTDSPKK